MKTTDITTILTADLNQGCVEAVVTAALAHGYVVLLTTDHGNADYAVNEDGALCNAYKMA